MDIPLKKSSSWPLAMSSRVGAKRSPKILRTCLDPLSLTRYSARPRFKGETVPEVFKASYEEGTIQPRPLDAAFDQRVFQFSALLDGEKSHFWIGTHFQGNLLPNLAFAHFRPRSRHHWLLRWSNKQRSPR